MELLEQFSRAQALFQEVVEAVRPDQYRNDTPDEGWDVRMLLNHVVGGNRSFAARLLDQPLPDRDADHLGDEPLASLRASATALDAAFRTPGSLDKVVTLPTGERTGLTLLRMRFNENLAHGWDIAKATGQETDREPDLYEAALAQAPLLFGAPRLPGGAYAPEQPVPEGASPADQLAAFLGKKLD